MPNQNNQMNNEPSKPEMPAGDGMQQPEAATTIVPAKRTGLYVLLAVVLVGLIAGAYIYTNNNKSVTPKDTATVESSSDPVADQLSTVSDSTDPATINEEISSTNLSDVDTELQDVEAELSNL